ncbi:hypothetical protein TIFTF001_007388 [Ficus carica]|uniref:Uncharacterized protein n=1 Tax=Ficus carica TaxID=3494 RepID=A0AA88D1Z3_FICCA|nr:hypothetical protein TIFTF001_007388 [Ficus carica]
MESCTTMLELRQIQSHMTRSGLITHTFPASRVLAFCALADAGDIRYAHLLFTQIENPNTYMWNTMIRGYAQAQAPLMGLSFFRDMARGCVEMDGLSFVYSLKACEQIPRFLEGNSVTMIAMLSVCGGKGDIRMGKRIYDYIITENVHCSLNLINATLDMFIKCGCLIEARKIFAEMKTRDVFSWTSMVNGYAKCGELDSAREFFEGMPEKNAISWNAMIAGYSQNNQPKEAVKLFHDMTKAGLVPTEHTLVCVLSACGQLGCRDLGRRIHHHHINRKGTQLSVILSNALVDMYAKCGSIDSAASLFIEMSDRNLVSWNTMIAGYASHGYAKQALILFEQMKRTELEPDCITFVAVLSACSHGGLVSEGKEHFKCMVKDYGIEPKGEHYACMIDLLGRIGLLEEAYDLIRNMPMVPSESAWGALLNACRMHGNVELAKLSAQKVLELDPQDSGIYVLLANAFANDKRWADVRMVRSMMREQGVKKSPGRSLIEIEGEFHEFLAGDESHPQSKKIYEVLNDVFCF